MSKALSVDLRSRIGSVSSCASGRSGSGWTADVASWAALKGLGSGDELRLAVARMRWLSGLRLPPAATVASAAGPAGGSSTSAARAC